MALVQVEQIEAGSPGVSYQRLFSSQLAINFTKFVLKSEK